MGHGYAISIAYSLVQGLATRVLGDPGWAQDIVALANLWAASHDWAKDGESDPRKPSIAHIGSQSFLEPATGSESVNRPPGHRDRHLDP